MISIQRIQEISNDCFGPDWTSLAGSISGSVHYGEKVESEPHSGAVFSTVARKQTVYVCGARIEGLINALKRLDKSDLSKNKNMFFDKADLGAIAIRDFFAHKTVNAELVTQALSGPFEAKENYVEASDGTLLRLKNYKPIVSQGFLDYLFGFDNSKPWLEPVIMAGGLWSDITAWDEAGKEIAAGFQDNLIMADSIKYSPRDVWLIELTGGPGTECDSCSDYTYDDVVDKYWPALVGGAIKFAGNKYPVAYVGHSNGGRVALDAMTNYSTSINKNPAGYLSDGTPFNLPANAVDTFIGVGVPGAFNQLSFFAKKVNESGFDAISYFEINNQHHISFTEIKKQIMDIPFMNGDKKISLNLFKKYYDLINSKSDLQPSATLLKSRLIYGTFIAKDDTIVPEIDIFGINSAINSGDKQVIKTSTIHTEMTGSKTIKTKIKEILNEG